MPQDIKEQKVIPFFRIQGSNLSLQPDSEMPTEKVWLEKEKLMMAILDSIHDGVFTIDFNMKVTHFNRAAERITGYSANEAIGKPCMDVFCSQGGSKEDCVATCPMKKTIKYKTPIVKKRTIFNKKGEILTVSSTTNLLFDLDNQPIGGVETFADITVLEKLKEKWQGKKYNLANIVGKNPKMTEIYDLIEAISGTLSNVLIQGETGTGKGLIASAIHYRSINHKGPFVHVNCAAMPENLLESELFGHVKGAFTGAISDRQGRCEMAHKGTLFLDEIGEISPAMQAKLLRVVEEKQFEKVGSSDTTNVDIRIIAATSKNLEPDILDRQFRSDLFFRLNIIPCKIPPLRERMEDIPLLVEHFVDKLNFKMEKEVTDLDPEIFDIFMRYPWPGNVRELESVMEYAFIQCRGNYLEAHFLPPRFRLLNTRVTDVSLSTPISSEMFQLSEVNPNTSIPTEKSRLLEALENCRWNRAKAAERLNISRTTLWRMMRKCGLS
ncbi:MAG: sigma 54-interacting transcriptional regulator [Desulfobacteraceae bacterium]|nr:MAG: sigma 54-interacting transcriptional regulator [Desulfobacteraceae bacterium]